MRRAAALPIWWLCTGLDRLPYYDRNEHRWFRGCWGCYPLRVSRVAMWIEGGW